MTYSIDIRKKALKYVREGASNRQAAERFAVDEKTIRNWLKCKNLSPKKHGPRQRKINKQELIQHVKDYPDMILRERAAHFGVHINAIFYAFKRLGIVKKTDALSGKDVYKKM